MKKTHYHFIGIGGIGMSALARILLDQKSAVSGSDTSPSPNIRALEMSGASIHIGQTADGVPDEATVVYSTAVAETNPEMQAAKSKKLPLMHRAELLAKLMEGFKTFAVAGTHGKTTTSSLLAHVLMESGQDPSFAIGGMIKGINGKAGTGDCFVAEADESDGSFLNYKPFAAIITNVEPEHMEHFKTEENLKSAFSTFAESVKSKNHLFVCGDDPFLAALQLGVTYGFGEKCALKISKFKQQQWSIFFDITFEGRSYTGIEVPLVGLHNALNAAAVFGLCIRLGLEESVIRAALKLFKAPSRRAEKKGEFREVLLLDDYAHHPTEIKTTLRGIREAIGERRLFAVFQPHRYTRVRDHLVEFAKSFEFADHVFVTDIYSAGESPIEGITTSKIIETIKSVSTVPVSYLPKDALEKTITSTLRPHDVMVTLGAGDITKLHDALISHYQENLPPKYIVGLIYGGRSCEHEVSLRSARFVTASLNPELYEVRHFGIDKTGNWVIGQEAVTVLSSCEVVSSPSAKPILSSEVSGALDACDLFFPVLHGPYGEDGTLQGFLEMLGKPYAGPNYRSGAICMDKVLTKKLAAFDGVPTPAFIAFSAWQWKVSREALLEKVSATLQYPVFVKPSHAGSSVGVSKVANAETLEQAIDYAFRFDTDILVEEGKEGCRELEFAVVGNQHGRIVVPAPGEKLASGEFVDYQMKYGKNSVKTTPSAVLDEKDIARGCEFARKAYESVGSTGMTRVDFLMDPQGNFWFFEMNPIPGLTPLSLFPKIWNREGVTGPELMSQLIILGIGRKQEQNRHLNPL